MIFYAIDALDVGMRIYMRVRSWFAPVGIATTSFGFRMHCDKRDFIQRRIFYFGIYEPNLTSYIIERLHATDHFLDVGANVGYMTLLASQIVGEGGRVVSIEAAPSTYQLLCRNLELNKTRNVSALNMAATGAPCEVEIVIRDARNIGRNAIKQAAGTSKAVVKGDALSHLAEIDASRLSFIKIDIEGSETPVLADLLENLDRYPQLKTIVVELSRESASMLPRFVAAGFRAYLLPNNYRIGYLFVRQYLQRSGESGFVVKRPVAVYDPRATDYVFERDA